MVTGLRKPFRVKCTVFKVKGNSRLRIPKCQRDMGHPGSVVDPWSGQRFATVLCAGLRAVPFFQISLQPLKSVPSADEAGEQLYVLTRRAPDTESEAMIPSLMWTTR